MYSQQDVWKGMPWNSKPYSITNYLGKLQDSTLTIEQPRSTMSWSCSCVRAPYSWMRSPVICLHTNTWIVTVHPKISISLGRRGSTFSRLFVKAKSLAHWRNMKKPIKVGTASFWYNEMQLLQYCKTWKDEKNCHLLLIYMIIWNFIIH